MNERATSADGPQLDLGAIMANGDRRIRRTRVASAVGVTAVLLTAAVAVPAVLRHDAPGGRNPQPANPTGGFVTRSTTYAIGTTIYYGDDAIDVSPHDVTSMVQTDFGFVFTAEQGDHQEVFFTDALATKRVGAAGQEAGTFLAADDSGSYVEWVDTTAEPLPEFVVYDSSTGKELARTSEGNKPMAQVADEVDRPVVYAIDGDTAYWHSSAGTVAYDLADGTQTVIGENADASYLFDVAGGVFARLTFDGRSTAVTTDLGEKGPPFVPGTGEPMLSPEGTYVTTTPRQSSRIFETATQQDVTPDPLRFRVVLLTQWIDDNSYAAIGTMGNNLSTDQVGQLVCNVPKGVCTPDRAAIGSFDELVFPTGGSLTDR